MLPFIRFAHPRTAPSRRSEIQSEDAGGVRLTPLLELRFPLLRHWSLFDSMKHAR
jgi:hypothetical protein